MDFKKLILPAGVAVIIGGLVWHFYRQVKMLQDFCYTFEGYKILELGINKVTLAILLQVRNKSDLDLTINGYDLSVSINDKFVSKIQSNQVQDLLANSKSQLNLGISFNPSEVLKGVLNLNVLQGALLDPKKVVVGIKGTISVSHKKVLKLNKVPVNFSLTLDDMMPKPGEVSRPCL